MPTGEPFSVLKGTDTDKMGISEIFGSSLGARSVSKSREGGLIRCAPFDELLGVVCLHEENDARDLFFELSGGF
jgi:hypothetical protein